LSKVTNQWKNEVTSFGRQFVLSSLGNKNSNYFQTLMSENDDDKKSSKNLVESEKSPSHRRRKSKKLVKCKLGRQQCHGIQEAIAEDFKNTAQGLSRHQPTEPSVVDMFRPYLRGPDAEWKKVGPSFVAAHQVFNAAHYTSYAFKLLSRLLSESALPWMTQTDTTDRTSNTSSVSSVKESILMKVQRWMNVCASLQSHPNENEQDSLYQVAKQAAYTMEEFMNAYQSFQDIFTQSCAASKTPLIEEVDLLFSLVYELLTLKGGSIVNIHTWIMMEILHQSNIAQENGEYVLKLNQELQDLGFYWHRVWNDDEDEDDQRQVSSKTSACFFIRLGDNEGANEVYVLGCSKGRFNQKLGNYLISFLIQKVDTRVSDNASTDEFKKQMQKVKCYLTTGAESEVDLKIENKMNVPKKKAALAKRVKTTRNKYLRNAYQPNSQHTENRRQNKRGSLKKQKDSSKYRTSKNTDILLARFPDICKLEDRVQAKIDMANLFKRSEYDESKQKLKRETPVSVKLFRVQNKAGVINEKEMKNKVREKKGNVVQETQLKIMLSPDEKIIVNGLLAHCGPEFHMVGSCDNLGKTEDQRHVTTCKMLTKIMSHYNRPGLDAITWNSQQQQDAEILDSKSSIVLEKQLTALKILREQDLPIIQNQVADQLSGLAWDMLLDHTEKDTTESCGCHQSIRTMDGKQISVSCSDNQCSCRQAKRRCSDKCACDSLGCCKIDNLTSTELKKLDSNAQKRWKATCTNNWLQKLNNMDSESSKYEEAIRNKLTLLKMQDSTGKRHSHDLLNFWKDILRPIFKNQTLRNSQVFVDDDDDVEMIDDEHSNISETLIPKLLSKDLEQTGKLPVGIYLRFLIGKGNCLICN
jgi:hypothetical protein